MKLLDRTRWGSLHPLTLTLWVSVWLASAANMPLWRQLTQLPEVSGLRGALFGLGFACAVAGVTHALACLLNWRYTLKPTLAALLLAAASGAYFMWSYGIVIDTHMLINVLQTDPREAADLFNLRLLLAVGVLGALPTLWLWRQPVRAVPWLRRCVQNALACLLSLAFAALCLVLIYQDFASVMRNHSQVRYLINPLNSIYAAARMATQPLARTPTAVAPIGQDARLLQGAAGQTAPITLVVVLGETARAGNFGINGYGRDTTPALAARQVTSFDNVWACGTSTAASVPCMFSHLGKTAYDQRSQNHETLVDVLHRAGLAVLWIDNQSGCKGVCNRVPHVNTAGLSTSPHCDSGECHDAVMLHDLAQRIAQLPAERRAKGVVIFMHQMGSHGPAYHKRSPAAHKRFAPECASNALQQCTREEVVNAYDNSIAYTDHFLGQTIDWLKQRGPAALVYVADHGESLGENNLYLHGLPYAIAPDVQKRVPWVTWLSSSYEQHTGLRRDCLQAQTPQRLSHDHFFHSVLGAAQVRAAEYQPALDVYGRCMPSGRASASASARQL